MEDRPSCQRNLVPTSGTLPLPPLHQLVRASVSTTGAHEAIRPTACGQVLLAGRLSGELRLGFPKVFGNGGRGTPLHYPLWSAETTGWRQLAARAMRLALIAPCGRAVFSIDRERHPDGTNRSDEK
jgi:hypothetical protein